MRSGNCPRVLGGWLAGCAAATVTIYALVIVVLGMRLGGDAKGLVAVSLVGLVYAVPIIFIETFVLSGLPAVLVIWMSEKFQLRSSLFFGGAGAAIGGLFDVLLHVVSRGHTAGKPATGSLLFAVAGLMAGLTYWLVAGKHAGRKRSGDTA